MSASEKRCPTCDGLLESIRDQPGKLRCPACNRVLKEKSGLESVGKALLILLGLSVIGFGIFFVGCLYQLQGL
jgi:hypothetical protein